MDKIATSFFWTKDQIKILIDMSKSHDLPDWYIKELERIFNKMQIISNLESQAITIKNEFKQEINEHIICLQCNRYMRNDIDYTIYFCPSCKKQIKTI